MDEFPGRVSALFSSMLDGFEAELNEVKQSNTILLQKTEALEDSVNGLDCLKQSNTALLQRVEAQEKSTEATADQVKVVQQELEQQKSAAASAWTELAALRRENSELREGNDEILKGYNAMIVRTREREGGLVKSQQSAFSTQPQPVLSPSRRTDQRELSVASTPTLCAEDSPKKKSSKRAPLRPYGAGLYTSLSIRSNPAKAVSNPKQLQTEEINGLETHKRKRVASFPLQTRQETATSALTGLPVSRRCGKRRKAISRDNALQTVKKRDQEGSANKVPPPPNNNGVDEDTIAVNHPSRREAPVHSDTPMADMAGAVNGVMKPSESSKAAAMQTQAEITSKEKHVRFEESMEPETHSELLSRFNARTSATQAPSMQASDVPEENIAFGGGVGRRLRKNPPKTKKANGED